jgi:hypothetical protein
VSAPEKAKQLESEANERAKQRMEEIKSKSPDLFNFLMEIKQRFGGGKITRIKFYD